MGSGFLVLRDPAIFVLVKKHSTNVLSGLVLNMAKPVHVGRLYAGVFQVMIAFASFHISNIVSYHGPGSRALLGNDFPTNVAVMTGHGSFYLQFFPLVLLHVHH